jgi:multidrug efflux pump
MRISEICIKRPVFATVISLIISIIGLISYSKLTLREYPNIDEPAIMIETNYAGASAEIMETQVTNILEESLAGIDGIEIIKSVNKQGSSQINLTFSLDTSVETAANDVRDKVARVRDKLPKEIEEPIISKIAADADPVIYLALSSDTFSELQISEFADRYVKDKLLMVNGVASVMIFADRRYSMRVFPDISRMKSYKVTTEDISSALRRQNVDIPSGIIEGKSREFSILTKSSLGSEEEFRNVIIKNEKGYLVRLSDIADVRIAAEDERVIARYKGKNSVALGIVKQSVANPLDISKQVRSELVKIKETLPAGVEVSVAFDKSTFIEESISKVYSTIFEAIVLVILIIYIFLRSVRSTFLPLVTIPISIIGAFSLMLLCNFSINTLTLLALILAIGLVVDDAIVMMENIYRYIEEGMTPVQAALKGSSEIGFAILAMTLTLSAVFIPIGFMEGITGKLFTEFAWTLALTVIVSGFIALTLSPMMASKILKKEPAHHGKFYVYIQKILDYINDTYAKILYFAFKFKKRVIFIGIAAATLGILTFSLLKSELAPLEDQSFLMGIFFGPQGSSLEYTNKYAKQLENIYGSTPDAEHYFMVIGYPSPSQGISFIKLKPWSERSKKQMDIANEMMPRMMGITGIMAFPINPPSISSNASGKPVQFVLQSSLPYDKIGEIVGKFTEKLKAYPNITNVETDLVLNLPRIEVEIDRDKAMKLGIEIDDIGRTLEVLIGGSKVAPFRYQNKQYNVIVQLKRSDRLEIKSLEELYVRSKDNKMIPLANIIYLKETLAPKELNHFNRMRAVQITANLAGGYTISDAIPIFEQIADEVMSKKDGKYEFGGESREFLKSSYSLYITFILALIFIYLVLAAQFESFKDPLIILLSVPLSITGALLTLYFGGATLNIYSKIGLITLIGLITKNGILIVEFTNQLIERGMNVQEAVIEASKLRLRPILMTTFATVFGALPLAFATGAGAASRNSIGLVIVGGLIIGTLFTIFLIPVVSVMMKEKSSN